MTRKLFSLSAFLAVALSVAACHDKSTVTGPSPAPMATATPVAMRTATPGPMPTPTPAPPGGQAATVNVGQGGSNFVDQQSGTSTTTIHAGGTVNWVWVNGTHSTTSGSCPGGMCQGNGMWDSGIGANMTFQHTFPQAGTFPYFCRVHQSMMQGTIVVQ